ncbi:uncharacterized protein [Littorina saxatilis]|uniref:F5/8 type C domain-containing protein n=1 Tax=Littorina saxatilis TaxID=31220 RepID=A0AAN9GCC9_9CAEN
MGKEEELLKAVKAKDIKKVQKLLTSASVKKKSGETTWQNVDTGHKIRKHLTHINVNAQETETGYTPLLLAVLGGLRDVAEMLIFYSANVLAQDFKGNTALHLAVFVGRVDLVTLLLVNEAEVNSLNDDHNTPLHIACQQSTKTPIIQKLVKAGANVWLRNKDHHTPLDAAAMYNKKETVSILLESCPTLLSNQCAVVEAAMRDNADVLELLLEYGIDPNQLDILRGSTALHEAVRFCRAKSAELLLAFGADVDKENLKKETPRTLSKELPAPSQERFESLFKEYNKSQARIPKYLAQRQSLLSDSFKLKCLKNYPVLPTQKSWTQNTREFCSSCTQANSNLHVVDDNPRTFWVIPEPHDVWTTLDLGSHHVISGISIIGWDSPQMVQTFQLQAADTLQGAWSTFTAHVCKRTGSTNPRDPGVEQTFKGFTVKVRYLRLYILANHGGKSINFQGLRLHGADCRINDILRSCHLQHLGDSFIDKGINTYKRFIDATEEDIASIVEDPVQVFEVYQAIQAERRKVYPMTMLEWLVAPTHFCYANEELPDFSVQSDPGVMEEVEVKVEGAELHGITRVCLCPCGTESASTAVFHGLKTNTVGKFTIKVQGVMTGIAVEAPEKIEIRPARKSSNEVSAAFDEIQDMLNSLQDSF